MKLEDLKKFLVSDRWYDIKLAGKELVTAVKFLKDAVVMKPEDFQPKLLGHDVPKPKKDYPGETVDEYYVIQDEEKKK